MKTLLRVSWFSKIKSLYPKFLKGVTFEITTCQINIAQKMWKYIVFSDPYFSVFGLNTGIYLRIQFKYGKIRTRKNSVFGTFYAVRPSWFTKNEWSILFLINNSCGTDFQELYFCLVKAVDLIFCNCSDFVTLLLVHFCGVKKVS